ncbi:YIP1 family protein [Roseisolibacter sp. H3M3-2]|uniref:YIP1 family protein n=1 Tax=Roseisolibacter sp. H3M3-2 TaxID=3031323 RepID=UPI0023DCE838|nr:YIP1 family protein [Roseisolibacter sp. H3M3-2]MDF1503835.1 YIP1 family protein [Roseisolibacter sp. H3M3-2]
MTESTAAAAPEKPAAVWEDFVDVFTQPSAVYARRRDGRFGMALLILSALTAAIFFATRPLLAPMFDRLMDAQVEAMRAQNPNMTEEQRAGAQATMERFGSVLAPVGAVVGQPILVLVVGALLFGASRLGGAPVSFGQAATIATYAQVPRLLGTLVAAGVLAVKDANDLPPLQGALAGPVLLLPRDASPLLVGVLSRFDLFTLWTTVLLGIGVAVMARTTRAKGWGVAAMVWGAATLWAVLSGLRAAAAMG